MINDQEVILALVRAGVGANVGKALALHVEVVEGVDWGSVIKLAGEQGVLGICYEGLSSLFSIESGECPVDMLNMIQWLGSVEHQKAEYLQRLSVAGELASKFAEDGVRTMVLKGVAFGRYYRCPELRYSCDFDCYLSDFDFGNKIAAGLGASVDSSELKHSHILYKGVHVENHRECTGVREDGLEESLTGMLFAEGGEVIEGTALELPPLMFDAVFCLYHARTHFVVEEGIQLRHVVDWILIRKKLIEVGKYEACADECRRFGMGKFLAALNGVADYVEGRKKYLELTESERLMWEDIWSVDLAVTRWNGWLGARLSVLRQIFRNGWKYRLYSDSSALREVFKYLGRFFRRYL